MLFRNTALLALPALVCGGTVQSPRVEPQGRARNYIIEYTPNGHVQARSHISRSSSTTILKSLDYSLFKGATISSTESFEALKSLDGIANVWHDNPRSAPVMKRRLLTSLTPENYTDTVHYLTGVDKLHERGIFGKGVKIGVLDTGIDYTHPALGGGFGPGFKVAGGYDFIGDAYNGTLFPDADPMDADGHGTMTSGVIAGKSDFYTGVVPEAEIWAYRVIYGIVTGPADSPALEALLRGFDDGMDILSCSFGAPSGFADDGIAVIADRIAKEGVLVLFSAGNEAGVVNSGAGAAGLEAMDVAAVNPIKLPRRLFEFNINNETIITKFQALMPLPDDTLPIVPISKSINVTKDGCSPFPNGTPSLKGKIALVRRGGCSFIDKQTYVGALDPEYILAYNNLQQEMEWPAIFDARLTPSGAIEAPIGEALITAYAAGGTIGGRPLSPDTVNFVDSPLPGLTSYISNWGPNNDFAVKSDIGGPGISMLVPVKGNTWTVESGTSLACPYIAGIAALYISVHGGREKHGKDFAKMLRRRIIGSGTEQKWYDGTSDLPATVAQAGMGLVDALKVLDSSTQLMYSQFALNDTRYFQGGHEVTIWNTADSTVSYSFSSRAAAGFESLTDIGSYPRVKDLADVTPISLEPNITLPACFSLAPNETKTVTVSFENPKNLGWNLATLPIYSGRITLTSSLNESLAIPYLGAAGDLRAIFEGKLFAEGLPSGTSGLDGVPFEDRNNFTMDLSTDVQDFPTLTFATNWGTKEVRFDIYNANYSGSQFHYPPTIGEHGFVGVGTSFIDWYISSSIFDPATMDKENTEEFPYRANGRSFDGSTSTCWWFGKLGNGSYIAPGDYIIRFAALKPFGNREVSDDWEYVLWPITILDYTP